MPDLSQTHDAATPVVRAMPWPLLQPDRVRDLANGPSPVRREKRKGRPQRFLDIPDADAVYAMMREIQKGLT